MKVYVVIVGTKYNSDHSIIGIFKSKDDATKRCRTQPGPHGQVWYPDLTGYFWNSGNFYMDIEEHEVK